MVQIISIHNLFVGATERERERDVRVEILFFLWNCQRVRYICECMCVNSGSGSGSSMFRWHCVLVFSFFVWMFWCVRVHTSFFACCRGLMCSSSFYNLFHSMFLLSITAPWELLLGNGRIFYFDAAVFAVVLARHFRFDNCNWSDPISKLRDICWANGLVNFRCCCFHVQNVHILKIPFGVLNFLCKVCRNRIFSHLMSF